MKSKISITVDEEILNELNKECSERSRTLSDFINSILVDWVKSRDFIKSSIPEILNGLSDIKKFFEDVRLHDLLNATSGSGTGGPERSEAFPEKSEQVIKSAKK